MTATIEATVDTAADTSVNPAILFMEEEAGLHTVCGKGLLKLSILSALNIKIFPPIKLFS